MTQQLSWIIHESRLLQTSLPGEKRRGNLMPLANHQEVACFAGGGNFIIAEVARSAHPKGKKCRCIIKESASKKFLILIPRKINVKTSYH